MSLLAVVTALIVAALVSVGVSGRLSSNVTPSVGLDSADIIDLGWISGTAAGLLIGVGWGTYAEVSLSSLSLLAVIVTLLLLLLLALVSKHYLGLVHWVYWGLVLLIGLVPAALVIAGLQGENQALALTLMGNGLRLIGIPMVLTAVALVIQRFQVVSQGDGAVSSRMAIVGFAALTGVALIEGQAVPVVMLISGLGAFAPFVLPTVRTSQAPWEPGRGAVCGWGAVLVVSATLGRVETAGILVFLPFIMGALGWQLRWLVWMGVSIGFGLLALGSALVV